MSKETIENATSSTPAVRHWYGLSLALLTALMWGTLPLGLQMMLGALDPLTVTWVRLVFSAVFVWLMLYRRNALPAIRTFPLRVNILTLTAAIALVGNFLLYLVGLDLLNPETTGIIIQLAPFLLMFGSVIFYGERMRPMDIIGVLVLFSGLALFFNDRLDDLFNSFSNYTLGVVAMVGAALSWSIYGLMQKTLLRAMNSMQLTLLIYGSGALLMWLVASPSSLTGLNQWQWVALLYCCINMVVGYGAFTEAMHVWQAAKVSTVIALAPVVTIISMKLAVWWWPAYFTDTGLNTLSYIGAVLVVAGSMLSSLGKARNKAKKKV